MTAKVVDLDALANPAREAGVSVGGTVYPVSPIRHADAHRIAVAVAAGEDVAISEAMSAAARNAVPTMPDAVFAGLTLEAVAAVVAISRAGVEAVEQMLAAQAGGVAGNA